jgi:iron complex outermembrane receptor protein
MKKIIFILALIFCAGLTAQEIKVSGVVRDDTKGTLATVSVLVKDTSNGTITDADGKYSIMAKIGDILQFSYVGLETKNIKITGSTVNVVLAESGVALQDVVILGSRSSARTVTASAVPIDVINMKDIVSQGPQVNLNQILNMVAPSFTSATQTVADGTDHIDPAQLRGLGPDQVLVLVNGKRRHTSSLVNVNGSPGRGAVGTDLNAIPAFAIERIEVLRDGASAQYGSDAIAGVINLNVKKNTNKLDVALFAGSNFSKGANNHIGGNDGNNIQLDLNYGTSLGKEKSFINATASFQIRDQTSRAGLAGDTRQEFTGYNTIERLATADGIDINSYFGNINNMTAANQTALFNTIKLYSLPSNSTNNNFSTLQQSNIATATSLGQIQTALKFDNSDNEIGARGLTRRDFNQKVGQSSLVSSQVFVNAAYPISKNSELYAFGGYSNRNGAAAGNYRRPATANASTAVYPNGFLPEIHSEISDLSAAVGLRGKIFESWNYDLSNTYGKNSFGFNVENSINATLGKLSPSTFDSGKLSFAQNTTNFDVSKKFDKLNTAFGLEFRSENYTIAAGEEKSYASYDVNGVLVNPSTATLNKPTDFYGNYRTGAAQVFPGFSPTNTLNKSRNSVAFYTDLEYDVTEKWMINGAVRFENYSDFGSTFNYKLATLYKISSNFNLRGAVATGFRAPSLHQIYFNNTSTQFSGGVAVQVGTFNNASQAATLIGIPKLKQEESQSGSVGFTAKIPDAKITITADAYSIYIKDRVVLTDQFARPTGTQTTGSPGQQLQVIFDTAGATAAQFFGNSINTRSKGLDIVISHKIILSESFTLKNDLAGTYSQTRKVGEIKASQILIDNGQVNRYYSEINRVYLEESVPRVKFNLTNSLSYKKFDFFLRNVYFGQVTDGEIVDANGDGQIKAIVVNGKAIENEHLILDAKIITDLSVGYNFTKSARIVIGANNLFDLYPTANFGKQTITSRASGVDSSGNVVYSPTTTSNNTIDQSTGNQFVYSRRTSQFGQNGRFLFARLSFSF